MLLMGLYCNKYVSFALSLRIDSFVTYYGIKLCIVNYVGVIGGQDLLVKQLCLVFS